jgi:hypothetical protein
VPNESAYLTEKQRHDLAVLGKRDPIFGRARHVHQENLQPAVDRSRFQLITPRRQHLHAARHGKTPATGRSRARQVGLGTSHDLNHKEAISYLVRSAERSQADEVTIRTLHYLLADSLVAPGAAGQIRAESIRVNGTTLRAVRRARAVISGL